MKRKRGRIKTSRIRRNFSYSVQEVCALLKVHKNTVREWLREGLPKIDTKRPLLIYGSHLKTFLETRQKSRKQKCALHELYCFRCRSPRRLMGMLADVQRRNEKTFMLTGFCEVCEAALHKVQSFKVLPKLSEIFDLSRQQVEGLVEPLTPSVECDFSKESKT